MFIFITINSSFFNLTSAQFDIILNLLQFLHKEFNIVAPSTSVY